MQAGLLAAGSTTLGPMQGFSLGKAMGGTTAALEFQGYRHADALALRLYHPCSHLHPSGGGHGARRRRESAPWR